MKGLNMGILKSFVGKLFFVICMVMPFYAFADEYSGYVPERKDMPILIQAGDPDYKEYMERLNQKQRSESVINKNEEKEEYEERRIKASNLSGREDSKKNNTIHAFIFNDITSREDKPTPEEEPSGDDYQNTQVEALRQAARKK